MKKQILTYEELEQKIKKLEHELKIRDEIIDKIPNPLFVKDNRFRYTICNNAFSEYIGLPKEKILNSTVYDISPKELADKYYKADKELSEKQENQKYESKVKYADQTLHDIIFHKACLLNEKKEFEGIVGIMLDITERNKVKEALKESKERYKKIVETSLVGIGITKEDKLIFGNPALFKIFGYAKKDALHKSILDFFHIDDRKIIIERAIKRAKGENIIPYMNLRAFNKKGELIYVDITTTEFTVNNQKYVQTIVVDITKQVLITKNLKENEVKLKELDATKNKFLSILAHDLRNPLNALLGFSDLLLKNLHKYDINKIEKYVSSINKITNQTHYLLEDLLLWSKSQTNNISFNLQKVKFQEVCDEVINHFRENARSKQIKINCFEPEELILSADLNMFKTILRNLISNAIKFTNKNGIISVYSQKIDINNAIITVSDNGVGIDEENQNKIWELSQSHSTTGTANEMGGGFGLVLCKEFVEKHGSKIWVESKVGQGSDFKFIMPLSY